MTSTSAPITPRLARMLRRLQLGQPQTYLITMNDFHDRLAIMRGLEAAGLVDGDGRLTEAGHRWEGTVKW